MQALENQDFFLFVSSSDDDDDDSLLNLKANKHLCHYIMLVKVFQVEEFRFFFRFTLDFFQLFCVLVFLNSVLHIAQIFMFLLKITQTTQLNLGVYFNTPFTCVVLLL